MTAPHITAKMPQTASVAVLFILAIACTLLAVPHVVVAARDSWPPQLMTLHVATALGLWFVAFRAQDRSRVATTEPAPTPSASPGLGQVDELGAVIHPLDQLELDLLEQRLRDTHG